ncbi:hypothetical protein DFQ27_000675, partial [Actinomortierella ambigua]
MKQEGTNKPSLELGDVIGSGVSAVVYKGRYNNQTAAIKRFVLRGHTVDDSEIRREIDQLKSFHSRFIIQYHGVKCQNREILLITDYADGGSLRQAIDDTRIIDWGQKERIAQEIAAGLAYIHQESILHRDLRSDNVLLTTHMDVKLCDFGLATIKNSSEDPSKDPLRSTLLWMAPELVLAGRPLYSSKSDMYALGMVMWEMAAMCTTPFKDMSSQHAAATAVYCGKREQLPGDTPSEYRGWVDLCWKQDPSERPDAINVEFGAHALSVKPCADTTVSLHRVSGAIPPATDGNAAEQVSDSTASSLVPSSSSSSLYKTSRVNQPILEEPYSLLSQDAESSGFDAQGTLAKFCEPGGDGVTNDQGEALAQHPQVAHQSHSEAIHPVGDMKSECRGTEQDDGEAAKRHQLTISGEKSDMYDNAASEDIDTLRGGNEQNAWTTLWLHRTIVWVVSGVMVLCFYAIQRDLFEFKMQQTSCAYGRRMGEEPWIDPARPVERLVSTFLEAQAGNPIAQFELSPIHLHCVDINRCL